MKVLVASRTLLGMRGRQNDIWEYPNVGEIVIPPFKPQIPLGAYADDEDGVARSFYALETGRRTSVALVREVPISEATYTDQLAAFVTNIVYRGEPLCESFNLRKMVSEYLHALDAQLKPIRLGELVEIRDGRIGKRALNMVPTR